MMFARNTLAFVFLATLSVQTLAGPAGLGTDGGKVQQIVEATCARQLDDTFVNKFFQCYDLLPEDQKMVVEKCQTQTWGFLLNTPANIQSTCDNRQSFRSYMGCLIAASKKAGVDPIKSLALINSCQATVLGLE